MRHTIKGYSRVASALSISAVSLTLFAVTISSISFAVEPRIPQGSTPNGEYETGATVPVPPWCAWYSSIPEDVLLAPNGVPDSIIQYRGDEIDISFASDWNYTYIGGADGQTNKGSADDCSWFGSPAYGSNLDVEISDSDFNAYIVEDGSLTEDPAMNFSLTSENPMLLERTYDEACDDAGNSFDVSRVITGLYPLNLRADAITSVLAASATTSNFCKWKSSYSLTIPASLQPTYTRADYAWIGPQMTYTLSFPE
jgi:hypothetical protein